MSSAPLSPGVATRLAAAGVLDSILKTRRSLDECFATSSAFKDLAPSDQGFARAMVSAALRQAGRLDEGYDGFVSRPVDELSREVRVLLLLGTAQLWLLDTPPHAAVGETVAAAKAWPAARIASGLVNAVLRKAAGDRTAFDSAPASSIWPSWLKVEFRRSLGEADMESLAAAQIEQPLLHLTCRDTESTSKQLGGEILAPGTVAVEMSRVDALEGFAEGNWWVQDVAAALAARILAPQLGERVFDLCAAPGGKTLQLAEAGAQVTALDRSKTRLERLRENLARTQLGDRVEVVQSDVEAWSPKTPANAILLDAPCSALGTLRRHPEGAWIKTRKEIDGYPAVQSAFLRAAADMLGPGGRLVYCVCTPRLEEGEDVISAAISQGGLVRRPIAPEECMGFEDCITPVGDVLTVPRGSARHDAFFIARLEKAL